MLSEFNVESSKNLDFKNAKIFVERLENNAISLGLWKKQTLKYQDLKRDGNMATAAQLRLIEGLWRKSCYFNNNQFAKKSLRKFIKGKFKIDDVMFITKDKVKKIVKAINEMQKNKSVATL